MKDYLFKAIMKLHPEAQFTYANNDYATIEWFVLEGKAPTQAQIDNAIQQVKADEAAADEAKAAAKAALLDRLGISADEAKLLLS